MNPRSLLFIAVASLLTLAGPATPVSAISTPITGPSGAGEVVGGIGLRLTEAPVDTRDDPRAMVYVVDHLAPGTVIERGIEVSNTTSSVQHIVLYSSAATIDGGSFVGAAGDTPNELSTWTSVSPSELDVAAGGALAATVKITVPSDAAPGEQYGVVWAEARSEAVAGGVTQVSRVGIRLYVSVGPGGAPAADFVIDSLTASRSPSGQPVISASVRNTGGRALDLNGTLQLLDGPGVLSAGPFPVDLAKTLAIGDTQTVAVTLDGSLPAGPWLATISLESGLTERSVEATVTFPDSGASSPVDTRTAATNRDWLLPAAAAALGVFVLLGLVALVIRLRRRR